MKMKINDIMRHITKLRSTGIWIPLLVAGLAIYIRVTSGPFPMDDAYITFRYAYNAATGLGMVYNEGEQVLGTSTPLFTLLLASIAKILGPEGIPTYALWINAISDGITTFLIFLLAVRMKFPKWMALTVALLQAFAPLSIRYSIGGMESSLVTALTLAATYSHLLKLDKLSIHLAVLAVLTRPDALAIGVLLIISQAIEIRRLPWKSIALFGGWIAIGAITLTIIYGIPIPHTIVAKSAGIYHTPPWTNALQFIYQFGGLIFGCPINLSARGIIISPTSNLNRVIWIFFIPQAALWIIGSIRCLRIEKQLLPLVFYPILFAFTYSLLGLRGSLIAEWYLISLIPFYLLPLCLGLVIVLERLTPNIYPRSCQIIALLFLLSELWGLNLGRNPDRGLWVPISVWDERELLYKKGADFLAPHVTASMVTAATEIGSLGYHCRCRILDTVGLVSPQVLKYYPTPMGEYSSNYIVPIDLIRDEKPDFLVSLEIFIRHSLLQDDWFKSHYKLVWQQQTDTFGSNGLLIYQRNP
jgi:hypothetical protein